MRKHSSICHLPSLTFKISLRLHIHLIQFTECLKCHINIRFLLKLKLILPFLCFPLSFKSSLTFLLVGSGSILIPDHYIPFSIFLVLVNRHYTSLLS